MVHDRHAGAVEAVEVEIAPVLVDELADGDRGDDERDGLAGGGEHLGRVEAGGVAAPVRDRDAFSVRDLSGEDVPGARHRHAVQLERLFPVRARAGRDDDGVGRARFGDVHGRPESHVHTSGGELPLCVVEERRGDGGVPGRCAGKCDLAAEARPALEEDDLMARRARVDRRGDPRRPPADDHEPAHRPARPRRRRACARGRCAG